MKPKIRKRDTKAQAAARLLDDIKKKIREDDKLKQPEPKPIPVDRRAVRINEIKTSCFTELEPVAKIINYRLQKAREFDSKSDDHRLAAAIAMGEAMATCNSKGVRFKLWVKENIFDTSYENARKLAAIGMDPSPALALADFRLKNAKANAEARMRARRNLPSPRDAMAAITQPEPDHDALERFKSLFDSMRAMDKIEGLKWAADIVGAEINMGDF